MEVVKEEDGVKDEIKDDVPDLLIHEDYEDDDDEGGDLHNDVVVENDVEDVVVDEDDDDLDDVDLFKPVDGSAQTTAVMVEDLVVKDMGEFKASPLKKASIHD